jgi:hypothetical protein
MQTRYYGSIKLGQHSNGVKDGHLPVKYDKSLRKTISKLLYNGLVHHI